MNECNQKIAKLASMRGGKKEWVTIIDGRKVALMADLQFNFQNSSTSLRSGQKKNRVRGRQERRVRDDMTSRQNKSSSILSGKNTVSQCLRTKDPTAWRMSGPTKGGMITGRRDETTRGHKPASVAYTGGAKWSQCTMVALATAILTSHLTLASIKMEQFRAIDTVSGNLAAGFILHHRSSVLLCLVKCMTEQCQLAAWANGTDGKKGDCYLRQPDGEAPTTTITITKPLTVYTSQSEADVKIYLPSQLWYDARDMCRALGLRLYTPRSLPEMKILFDQIGSYWTGGNDVEVAETFVNEDGSPFNEDHWCESQPNRYCYCNDSPVFVPGLLWNIEDYCFHDIWDTHQYPAICSVGV